MAKSCLRGKVITANFIWTGNTFENGIQMRIDQNGFISEIGKNLFKGSEELFDFGQKALIPGFVNSHSHAFHRYMRGRSHIGSSYKDSFWKWREDMYSVVEHIDEKMLYECTHATFTEMLSAGITTVGEFHYLHHGKKRFSLDQIILNAAQDAGIRIVLINTLYCNAGFDGSPLTEAQKKFISSVNEFIENIELLQQRTKQLQTIAVAAHSLRAVSVEDISILSKWCQKTGRPMHIHLEEQQKEIEDCRKIYGCDPSELLLQNISHYVNITAVHCTHTTTNLMQLLAQNAINICICPLTEGYLGDGIPNIVDEAHICLGTDCNNRICMLEEMRWLTYCQHMLHHTRNACGLDARKLLCIATENGAKSLGIENLVGRFSQGMQFDFVAFDLCSPRLGQQFDDLLDAIVFGGGNGDIALTGVSGMIVFSRN